VAPVGDYAASCLARERAFTAAAAEHGTRLALIRLNYSVEFRYGVLIDIAQRVLRREPVDVTTGYVNVIWQRDAVAHTIQTAALVSQLPVVINITGAEILSVRAVAQRFGELLGRPVHIAGREAETAWLNNASYSHRLFGAPEIDIVFEATGSPRAAAMVFEPLAPGGCVVMIGGQPDPISYDAGAAMVREARVENIFRYAHVFPRCVAMLASGAIDVKPLITRTFDFDESVRAFEIAASAPPADVKMQIELPQ
jgi:hypothetical protein